jgi:hypothetical protein
LRKATERAHRSVQWRSRRPAPVDTGGSAGNAIDAAAPVHRVVMIRRLSSTSHACAQRSAVETRRTAGNTDAHDHTSRTSRAGSKPDRGSPARVRAARASCMRVRRDATEHQRWRARQRLHAHATCEPEQDYRERDARQT